jgi:hypothetical protein
MRQRTSFITALVLCVAWSTGQAQYPQYPVAPSPVLTLARLTSPIQISGYLSVRETLRNDSSAFALNRARLTAQSLVMPFLAVRMQADLAAIGRTRGDTVPSFALTDAYIQLSPRTDSSPSLQQLRPAFIAGQFKTPFSLEYLTSYSSLLATNRSQIVDRFALKRDIGALGTVSAGRYATVYGAVVNGEGSNVTGNADGKQMLIGRGTVFPLKSLGVSGKWASQGADHRWGYDARWSSPRVVVEGEVVQRASPTAATSTTDASGGYALAAVRPRPWLQPVVKWERLHVNTTTATAATDSRATWITYGLNFVGADQRVRLLLNWVDRMDPAHSGGDELIVQLLAIF